MKGFSGFKASPVKAADAGLVKAADLMDRGLKKPTSLIGEGVIGFLEGLKKSYKPDTRSEAEIDQKKKEESDDWWYNKGKGRGGDKIKKNKKISLNIRDLFKKKKIKNPKVSTTGTLSPEEQESFLEQYDPMSNIEKSEEKTRRNKRK